MTKNNKITGLLGFFILGILFMGACQNNVNTPIEESIAPYLELQALDEASNATITVNRGETVGFDSYFAFDLSNIKADGIVREGLTEGWCLEWDKPIRQNNDVHHGIEMFNTFGSTTWKPANYLMNIKDELKAEDPALTYKEIQVALWTLIETPAFDLDQVLQNGDMPSRLMENGQPNFDVDKVKAINNRVRSEVAQFEYDSNSSYILFSNMRDEQNGGIINGCKGFRTQTPGGWGSPAAGDNPGEYRDANFDEAFPNGLVVGGDFTLTLTSASAVEDFLPSGGSPAALNQDYTDPTQALGTLAGHVVALSLSIGFDECTTCDPFGSNTTPLKDLIFDDGSVFDGMTVEDVLAEANRVLGGGAIIDFTASQLNDALTAVNENFVDGEPADDPDLLRCPSLILL